MRGLRVRADAGTADRIRAEVGGVVDQELGCPLDELGMLGDVDVRSSGAARIVVRIASSAIAGQGRLRSDVEHVAGGVDGVGRVEVVFEPMDDSGRSMSTTGYEDGPPTSTGAQIGDSGTGIHLVAAILAALYQRVGSGRGQRVQVAMQEAVLNLARVKLRDQQRLTHGPLNEYPNSEFTDEVPRSGNASGGGQPGWAVRCAPGGPNDYIYVIVQPVGWKPIAELIGRPELVDDPDWNTPSARLSKLDKMFALIEEWTEQHSKWEVMDKLNSLNVPCGPILSTKDLIEDETLAENGAVVEVPHSQRGAFKTVGCPLKLSDSPVEVETSPLLGQHTAEIYGELGIAESELEELKAAGVI